MDYPLHGYAHTFLFGGFLGLLWGGFSYYNLGTIFLDIMKSLYISYSVSLKRMLISGILGVWFHIITDSILYSDIKPFYPFSFNPMYGLIGIEKLYLICLLLFIPVLIMLLIMRHKSLL
jgi:membrane-bound metal-dependent hydrolase YbcI (DUF457 family)